MRYKITYTGKADSISIAGHTIDKLNGLYLDELPMPKKQLLKISDIHLEEGNFIRPNKIEIVKSGSNYVNNKRGCVWVGPAPIKLSDFGRFEKDKPRFDLTDGQIDGLLSSNFEYNEVKI